MKKRTKTAGFWRAENSKNFRVEGKSNLFAAIATLAGTIVGAGILGIPYTFAKAGFIIGFVQLILLGVILLVINLYFGEIVLRTKQRHQLPGYAEKYLGKKGKIVMLISSIVFLYGALTAYIIGEGEVLSFILFGNPNFSILSVLLSIIFFFVMLPIVYLGLKALEKGETFGLIAVASIILIIFFVFLPRIQTNNFMLISSNPIMWFMPYGVILFAFLALSALPEVREELVQEEKKMKKAIIIGSLIPIVLYILFVIAVYGVFGYQTPEIATIALGKLPSLLAIFTMFTAFCAVGIALKELYIYDFKLKHDKAFALAFFPLFIFVLFMLIFDLGDFVKILNIVGGVSGGLAAIMVLLMLKKAKQKSDRKPEYSIPLNWPIIIILSIIFIAGIVYQFVF